MRTIEAKIKKLEAAEAKKSGGPERIIVSYPDGRAFYYCGTEAEQLESGETWPEHDYNIKIVYDNVPLPNHGVELDLTRGGDN